MIDWLDLAGLAVGLVVVIALIVITENGRHH